MKNTVIVHLIAAKHLKRCQSMFSCKVTLRFASCANSKENSIRIKVTLSNISAIFSRVRGVMGSFFLERIL